MHYYCKRKTIIVTYGHMPYMSKSKFILLRRGEVLQIHTGEKQQIKIYQAILTMEMLECPHRYQIILQDERVISWDTSYHFKDRFGNWRDGSATKSSVPSTYIKLLTVPVPLAPRGPLTSSGLHDTCIHVHIPSHRYACIH